MATKLGQYGSRAVTRESACISKGRAIIVRLEANGAWLAFREKGRRLWYRLPIESAIWHAVKLLVAERKAEKIAARKARQLQRAGV